MCKRENATTVASRSSGNMLGTKAPVGSVPIAIQFCLGRLMDRGSRPSGAEKKLAGGFIVSKTLKTKAEANVEIISEGHPLWDEYQKRAEEIDRRCCEKNARQIGDSLESVIAEFGLPLGDVGLEDARYLAWLGGFDEGTIEDELRDANLL